MAQQPFMPQHWWHQGNPAAMLSPGGMGGMPRNRMGTPRGSRERVDRQLPQPSPQQSQAYECRVSSRPIAL